MVAFYLFGSPGFYELGEVVEHFHSFPLGFGVKYGPEIGEISDIRVVFCNFPAVKFIFAAAFPQSFHQMNSIDGLDLRKHQIKFLLTLVYIHALNKIIIKVGKCTFQRWSFTNINHLSFCGYI